MELLVLGAEGLLGSNVVAEATSRGYEVTATHHSERLSIDVPSVKLNLRDVQAFENLCADLAPRAVINCAAVTDVDHCEEHRQEAEAVNGRAPGKLASIATEIDASFVQASTDYVFDGESRNLYSEKADPNPIQVYGRSKLLGERTVREAHPAALIPRMSFVYGRHAGTNELEGFPAWVRTRLSNGEQVPAFVDQRMTPTRARQAGDTILDLLKMGVTGIVHVACSECTSPFAFSKLIAEIQGTDVGLIDRKNISDDDRPADRPRHTCLDVSCVENILGRLQPTLVDDIEAAF